MDHLPPTRPSRFDPNGPAPISAGRRRGVGIGMICAGLLFFFGSLLMIETHWQFVAQAKHAQGRVVRLVSSSTGSHRSWVPRFSFQDATGKEWQATSHDANGLAPYHVGDPVDVLYLPQNPAGAKIGDLTSSWGSSAVLAFCGVFCFGVGCLVCRTKPFEIRIGG